MQQLLKVITLFMAVLLLSSCVSQEESSAISAQTSEGASSVHLNTTTESTLEPKIEYEFDVDFNDDTVFVFHADDTEYYRNGKLIPIEGPAPVMKDGIMYLSLEYLFDLLGIPNYEQLREVTVNTGNMQDENVWRMNTGEIIAYDGIVQPPYGGDDAKYEAKMISITCSIISGRYGGFYSSEVPGGIPDVKWIYDERLDVDGEIYIPANMVNYLPQGHNAQYLKKARTLAIYGGITPALPIFQNQMPTEKNWQTLYTEIVQGNNPLGPHFFRK